MPAWLIGLIIAAVLFVLVVFVFDAFGIEDEPALDAIVNMTDWTSAL